MSLESYLREIRAQREKESPQDTATQPAPNKEITEQKIIYIERTRRQISWPIILVVFAIIFAILAFKNPTVSESKKLINSFIVEKVKDYANMQMSVNTDMDFLQKGFGNLLINELAPKIIEAGTQTKVSNFYIFSSFKVEADPTGEKKNLMSGIILLGKIIPLSSDIDFDKLEDAGIKF